MADKLTVLGARGASLAELARRTGNYGVAPTDNDYIVLTKLGQNLLEENPAFQSTVPGPAGPTYVTLSLFRAAPTSNRKQALADPAYPAGDYYFETANAPYTESVPDVIAADGTPLSIGAWVRQRATGITVNRPAATALIQNADTRLNDQRLHSGTFVTAANSNGTTDNRAALQAMLDAGDCELLARTYAISDELVVPAGRKITLQPGATLVWLGTAPSQQSPKGFFRIASGGNQIVVNASGGGKAFFVAPGAMGFLHAVIGYATDGVLYSGFDCTGCSGAYFDTTQAIAAADDYTQVVTPDMIGAAKPGGGTYAAADVNVSRNIRQIDCDVRMREPSFVGVALQARYCYDVEVTGGKHRNLYAGVQWWGGDSGFGVFPPGHPQAGKPKPGNDPNNQPKCRNFKINNCDGADLIAAYWGSMGRDITVDGARANRAHDVAFDCEGGWDVIFKNCIARDGYNGCFTTFNNNRGVKFINCVGEVTNKAYLLSRIYNESQSAANNLDVAFIGGRLECLDPTGPARIDTNSGPIRSYKMLGTDVVNAVVDISGCNQVELNFSMRLPYKAPAAMNFVSLRDTQGGGNFAPPMAKVSGCSIYSEVAQPAGSVGYYAIAGDPNSTPDHIIVNNTMRMPLDDSTQAGIRVVSAGRGSFPAAFTVRGNMVEGPIASATSQGPAGLFDIQQNFTARGGVPVMG